MEHHLEEIEFKERQTIPFINTDDKDIKLAIKL